PEGAGSWLMRAHVGVGLRMEAVAGADAVVDLADRDADVEVLGPDDRVPRRREGTQGLVTQEKGVLDESSCGSIEGDHVVDGQPRAVVVDVAEGASDEPCS